MMHAHTPELPVATRIEAPERIETPRLVGSRIAEADLDDFKSYYCDAAVMRRLSPNGAPYDDEAASNLFRGHMDHWKTHGFGTWMFRDAAGRFVGRAGLRSMELDGRPEVELFYGVASDRWGRGYGTEMARSIVSVAFETMRVESLVAFTLPSNRASLRILGKCGFSLTGELAHAGLRYGRFRLGAS